MEQARCLAGCVGVAAQGCGPGMGDARWHHRQSPSAFGGTKRGLGRSRGGISTKIHLISDAHGNPLDFLITPGQAHESKSAQALLCGWKAKCVMGDRAYDGDPVRKVIAEMGAEAPRSPSPASFCGFGSNRPVTGASAHARANWTRRRGDLAEDRGEKH